ncbi:hypothetical protein AB0N16_16595 [Streptomyces sp. NPDC051105]|uniref:hypothetical protein n=1 Tax=Streptomyces sp. NPDC051105 TaxID=3154843 RepID=UPI003417CCF1
MHGSPDQKVGGYRVVRAAKFGEKVLLPDPIGIELGTEILKNYVRWAGKAPPGRPRPET